MTNQEMALLVTDDNPPINKMTLWAEREHCAKIAESMGNDEDSAVWLIAVAKRIRSAE